MRNPAWRLRLRPTYVYAEPADGYMRGHLPVTDSRQHHCSHGEKNRHCCMSMRELLRKTEQRDRRDRLHQYDAIQN